MSKKLLEDVVSLSDLKANPRKVVTRRPFLLTNRGREVAVIQRFEDYERTEKELRFMKVVALGLLDAQKGDTTSVEQARGALGLE
ncbi:hypothetical protein GCM10007426_43660 [Alloalcanivorax dieselolei]|uniref:type II toxin-antitoxin system Phd/YefM family antitoxin n=1 Tax=Alloalcanivorax dieselolei TaxID=285091 RepID=UPI0005A1DF6E|nr:type II toxin-antitoxin system Phd/YefM family antitoxin [Alloalcanivorax dieselolei]GGK10773.1 hypothetical protein GCM10007426_43660 [Alloalcanivorax dieselolei]